MFAFFQFYNKSHGGLPRDAQFATNKKVDEEKSPSAEKSLQPIYPNKNPTQIYVIKEETEIAVTPEALPEVIDQPIEWCETIMTDVVPSGPLPSNCDQLSEQSLQDIQTQTQAAAELMALHFVNDKIKYEVVSRKFIAKGTLLGINAGEFSDTASFDDSDYVSDAYNGRIDGKKYRNFTNFFLDGPLNLRHHSAYAIAQQCTLLQDYALDPSINDLDKVAVDNVKMCLYNYKQYPIIVWEAERDIPEGHRIVRHYGAYYFQERKIAPALFHSAWRTGSVIDSSLYTIHRVKVTFQLQRFCGEETQIISHKLQRPSGELRVRLGNVTYVVSKEDYEAAEKKYSPQSPFLLFSQPSQIIATYPHLIEKELHRITEKVLPITLAGENIWFCPNIPTDIEGCFCARLYFAKKDKELVEKIVAYLKAHCPDKLHVNIQQEYLQLSGLKADSLSSIEPYQEPQVRLK
jgi:hypothetical protein